MDKRSNSSWKYTLTVRKGAINITDSRRKEKNSAYLIASVSMNEMREDLTRMLKSADNAKKLIDTMTL
jgi:hypothetical protein